MAVLARELTTRTDAALKALNRIGTVRAAYVFGSHVDGCADRWSDIDIAAFMDGVELWDIRRRAHAMARVQKEAGLEVEAHLFSAATLGASEPGSFADYVKRHGVCIFRDEDPSH